MVPKGMKRIFTTNIDVTGMWLDEGEPALDKNGEPLHPFPRGGNREQQKAIDRRYSLMPYVDAPLFSSQKMRFRKEVVSVVKTLLKKKELEGSAWPVAPSEVGSDVSSLFSRPSKGSVCL